MARRAIIYTRVSSDQTGLGRSVSEQETECRALCEREGWAVAEVLSDNDIGASRYSRGERSAYGLLADVLQPADVLVTWEASRTTRDLEAYVALRNLCAERGVLWSYSGRTYDLNSGGDRFLTGLDALLSEQEAERTRERVMRSVRARAASGRPHSRPPFGYKRDIDPESGRSRGWKVDPGAAATVREIFRRFLAGHTLRSIYRDLAARGVYAGTYGGRPVQWDARLVKQILTRASYAGLRIHRGEIVGQGSWEPIVSESDYLRVGAIFSDPDRPLGSGSDPVHLLTGIAVCGVCRRTVKAAPASGHRQRTYACPEQHVRRLESAVDELVAEVVLGVLDDPEIRARLAAPTDDSVAHLDEARELRARLQGFADAAAAGEVSPASLARIEERLLPQIAEAERRSVPRSPLVSDLLTHTNIRQRWQELELVPRREIVRTVVRPVILPAVRGRKTFDPETVGFEWKAAE